jgi:AcrR family transcriptional regulator
MKTKRTAKITPRWPVRSNSRQRFQVLLNAVAELLVDHDPSEITVHLIARRADAPPATVYHFFPSADAALLAQAHAYLEDFLRMSKEPAPDGGNWRDVWRFASARARDAYTSDAARMRLLLADDVPSDVQTAGQAYVAEIGRAVTALLAPRVQSTDARTLESACVHAIAINGMFWRTSYRQARTITDAHFEEGLRASLAYLGTYLSDGPNTASAHLSDRAAP